MRLLRWLWSFLGRAWSMLFGWRCPLCHEKRRRQACYPCGLRIIHAAAMRAMDEAIGEVRMAMLASRQAQRAGADRREVN